MNRRRFLASFVSFAAAPAIVRADSLMRIRPLGETIVVADSNTYGAIKSLSEEARKELIEWWAKKLAREMARSSLFGTLVKAPNGPLILPDQPRIILPEEEPWITKSTPEGPPTTC